MKPSALILTAGIVASGLSACVSPPPPQAASLLPPTSRPMAVCGVNTFLSKVHFMATPFHLPDSGFQSAPPIDNTPLDSTPITAGIRDDLVNAFTIAPDFFRNQLCNPNLTGIYIDPTGCTDPHDPNTCVSLSDQQIANNSWGFRAFDPNGNSAGKFIGTSLALWRNGGQAPTFDLYRTRRLALVLNKISNGFSATWSNPPPPTYSNAYPNNSGVMSVLAALAHELGHVLWYDAFVSPPGGSFSAANFCEGFYTTDSWSPAIAVSPNRWIAFGEENSNITHKPDYISVLQSDLRGGLGHPRPNFGQAGEDIHKLLQDQGLASVLAAVSPDEDFVETFELYVLLRASSNGVRQLQSFPINVTGNSGHTYPHNDATDFKLKYNLIKKMSCFGTLP
jgi:hypothetical protein